MKKDLLTTENSTSIQQISDKLVRSAKDLLRTAQSEEDLRIGFEKALDPLLRGLAINSHASYEKSVYRSGRTDALHGQVIIEYEKPRSLSSDRNIKHTLEQLVIYIQGESASTKDSLFQFGTKLIGVGFDGETIFFVRYKGDKTKPKVKLGKEEFAIEGPYEFDQHSVRTLLTYLRALSRRPLTAENLASVFGPNGDIARQAVPAFADALKNWGKTRVQVFFKEWQRLFGIVYGEKFASHQAEEAQRISTTYGARKETSFQELLFSVHTYFALLMKLIAAELLTLKESALSTSYCSELAHLSKKDFQARLTDLEEGGIFAKRGISNFLEGDFFRWYVDAPSPALDDAIREIARGLADFEPATTTILPDSTRDLLKKLYQYLVPKEVRHNLGEYYTPDWLAELILNEVGYDGNTQKRLLDPACGSGTFLVLAIQKARKYAQEHKVSAREAAKKITTHIWGFDLNPLAVIAARTNYLFALGNLASELEDWEIPIYLADSVLWPDSKIQTQMGFEGDTIEIQTSIGRFNVPIIWIQSRGFLMGKAAPLVEKMVKEKYDLPEAMKKFSQEGLVYSPHEKAVEVFYSYILKLEREGKNGIWSRFLKNVFAPYIAGKFDYVVGNPPWIRWVYLSEEYRKATFPLWQKYGLFSLKGTEAWLGGSEKDFSMLFTYVASDYYLPKKGKLGFLITQEVFKSKGAGEGFRRFQLGQKEYLGVIRVHDLTSVKPFENAANKTAAIILKKGQRTRYPVTYIVWRRKQGAKQISGDEPLDRVHLYLRSHKTLAQPIDSLFGSWRNIEKDQGYLDKLHGRNCYRARLGARVEPYGVFWLELKQKLNDGDLIVRNLSELGKRKVATIEERIEPDLVYPAVRGADIQRWASSSGIYILITENLQKGRAYSEEEMKQFFPRTYSYLLHFKDLLLDRRSHLIESMLKRSVFFVMSGMLPHVFAPYKVVWKRMSTDIYATVLSQTKTPFGYRIVVPTDTTSVFAAENELEAHYICSIINSTDAREFIKSYSSAGRGFGTPSVMEHVGIPKFDPSNKLHLSLAEISKSLHEAKAKEDESKVVKLEKENDVLVRRLFGIK